MTIITKGCTSCSELEKSSSDNERPSSTNDAIPTETDIAGWDDGIELPLCICNKNIIMIINKNKNFTI